MNSAITVHNNLQGAVLASSDRGGMRLQYPFFQQFVCAWTFMFDIGGFT